MANAQIKSTTQNFTEIQEIIKDIVIFKNGNACVILEVAAVNFYLLSKEEQEARLFSFVSFLNSLSFAIQILVVSKNVDISTYLSVIEARKASETRPKILEHLKLYKEFIESLLKARTLLDKKFYIVIPFSHLELGPLGDSKQHIQKNNDALAQKIESMLTSKKVTISTQLARMGLTSKQLNTDELIKLYYELYNQEELHTNFNPTDVKNILL